MVKLFVTYRYSTSKKKKKKTTKHFLSTTKKKKKKKKLHDTFSMAFFNTQNDTSFGSGNVFATVTVMQRLQRCTFFSGTVVHPKIIQATFTHPHVVSNTYD